MADHHDGTFTYTPSTGFSGVDSFSFVTTATAAGLPTLTISGLHAFINSTSTVTPDTVQYSLYQGQTLSVSAEDSVLNRSDSSDNLLEYTLFGPDGSTLTGTSQGGDMVYTTAGGTLTVYADRSYDYTANGDFVGRDNIGFCFGSTYDSAKPLGAMIFDSDQIRPELIIDGDNNDGYALPDGTLIEHAESTDSARPGKYVDVNDGDLNDDGIPDYAELIADPNQHFVPMQVWLPLGVDLATIQISFHYDASDPQGDVSVSGTGADTAYSITAGTERIWLRDGTDPARSYGDFLGDNQSVAASALGFVEGAGGYLATVFLEAVAMPTTVTTDGASTPQQAQATPAATAPASQPASISVTATTRGAATGSDMDWVTAAHSKIPKWEIEKTLLFPSTGLGDPLTTWVGGDEVTSYPTITAAIKAQAQSSPWRQLHSS